MDRGRGLRWPPRQAASLQPGCCCGRLEAGERHCEQQEALGSGDSAYQCPQKGLSDELWQSEEGNVGKSKSFEAHHEAKLQAKGVTVPSNAFPQSRLSPAGGHELAYLAGGAVRTHQ